jgi:hypothetical protein
MATAVCIHHQEVNRVAAHVKHAQSHTTNLAGRNTNQREVGRTNIV